MCWKKEGTEIDIAYLNFDFRSVGSVYGVDCGKDTWVTLHEINEDWGHEVGAYLSLAGRIAFEDNYPYLATYRVSRFSTVRVGPYDDTIMPAVLLFDDYNGKCGGAPSRHFFDPTSPSPGEVNDEELADQRKITREVDSVMLRPGYKVVLYR